MKHSVKVITRGKDVETSIPDIFEDAKIIIDRGILQVIDDSKRCAENGYRPSITEYNAGFWNKVIYDGE